VQDLTITRVETESVRVPLETVYKGSHYKMTHRSTTITRIFTKSGLVGEAYAGDEDAGLLEIDAIIHDELAPRILGQDASAIEKIWELCRPATWDILRDRRLGLVATASIDTTLWDLLGKAYNAPLWKLWGGYRSKIPVITIGGYTVPQAIKFSHLVADDNLLWFEEPCIWQNDKKAMRDVRYVGNVAVTAGQTEFSAAGCRDLMETGSIDFCNFDSSWSGGPTEWRRAAAIATVYDVKMAHHEEPQVASHLLASIPHGTYLEFFHPKRDPIWHNMIANRPHLKDGYMQLSDAPGLGWELNRDYINRYRIAERVTEAK